MTAPPSNASPPPENADLHAHDPLQQSALPLWILPIPVAVTLSTGIFFAAPRARLGAFFLLIICIIGAFTVVRYISKRTQNGVYMLAPAVVFVGAISAMALGAQTTRMWESELLQLTESGVETPESAWRSLDRWGLDTPQLRARVARARIDGLIARGELASLPQAVDVWSAYTEADVDALDALRAELTQAQAWDAVAAVDRGLAAERDLEWINQHVDTMAEAAAHAGSSAALYDGLLARFSEEDETIEWFAPTLHVAAASSDAALAERAAQVLGRKLGEFRGEGLAPLAAALTRYARSTNSPTWASVDARVMPPVLETFMNLDDPAAITRMCDAIWPDLQAPSRAGPCRSAGATAPQTLWTVTSIDATRVTLDGHDIGAAPASVTALRGTHFVTCDGFAGDVRLPSAGGEIACEDLPVAVR